MKKKLLFLVNVDWFFLSHRLPVALAALQRGYEVHIAAGITDKYDELRSYGLIVHPLHIGRNSLALAGEALTFWNIVRLFRKVRPHIIHLVTLKPVLYGGIAARLTGVPCVVAAISGLGVVFQGQGWRAAALRIFVASLFRLAMGKRNLKVICQNPDDREKMMRMGGLSSSQVVVFPGSGVDLNAYPETPLPEGEPVVVMAARLLCYKGVHDFVEAARLIRQRNIPARFWLIGDTDSGNSSTVTSDELRAWKKEGHVEILGYRQDIASLFSQAHVVVLPSFYGEGLPKVLIEAAACGRPVVTTDHPGCRDAIEPGKTGLLVPPRNPIALADTIQYLITDSEALHVMGVAGRIMAEEKFNISKVVEMHLKIYDEVMTSRRR